MSELNDTLVRGRVTQTLAATDPEHLIRKGEAELLNVTSVNGQQGAVVLTTVHITEGANLYFTQARAIASPLTGFSAASGGAITATDTILQAFGKTENRLAVIEAKTTTNIAEGSNLYFTEARVRGCVLTGLATGSGGAIAATDTILQAFGKTENRLAAIEAWDTDDVDEGVTNLYFTNARARAAVSATAPVTYDSGTGAFGVNAASANTVNFLAQRDANGDFAMRKLVLGTSAGTDHVTFGGTATMGYNSSGIVAFNKPVQSDKYHFGTTHELRTDTGQMELFSTVAALNVFATDDEVLVVTALRLAGQVGVLLADVSGNVTGGADTDDLSEGSVNLYYTAARANAAADTRISIQKGAANGLASLGADSKLTSTQIPAAVLGGAIYSGTWNATTNSPVLASGTGTKGAYYVVATAGATNLDGITDWKLGDWAIFNGTVWEKVDNTDAVLSVNSFVGAVVLDTDDVAEGSTNLYYTDARVRACVLTGLSTGTGGAIAATDTILAAFGRTQNRLAAIEAWDTDDVDEGSTNLYYTDARVLARAVSGLGVTLVAPAAGSSGSPYALTVTGPAHTTLAAGTEASDVVLNLERIVQFATGALTTQRAVRVAAPKYAFVGASTLTDASTLEISGAPVSWTNATLTNAYGLKISAGAVAAGNTNAYGLYVSAPTGATNNYAAVFATGNVGIGTAAPTVLLDIAGDTIRVRTARTPASASATGAVGEICWDTSFVYVCTATNTWKRAAIATW